MTKEQVGEDQLQPVVPRPDQVERRHRKPRDQAHRHGRGTLLVGPVLWAEHRPGERCHHGEPGCQPGDRRSQGHGLRPWRRRWSPGSGGLPGGHRRCQPSRFRSMTQTAATPTSAAANGLTEQVGRHQSSQPDQGHRRLRRARARRLPVRHRRPAGSQLPRHRPRGFDPTGGSPFTHTADVPGPSEFVTELPGGKIEQLTHRGGVSLEPRLAGSLRRPANNRSRAIGWRLTGARSGHRLVTRSVAASSRWRGALDPLVHLAERLVVGQLSVRRQGRRPSLE